MKRLILILPLVLTILLAACARDLSPDTYSEDTVDSGARVYKGVIVSMRPVKVKGNSGLGGVAGATSGAVLGSAIGGGRGSILTGIAGAVAGGVAGNAIDKSLNKQTALEYIIKLENHKTMAVVQAPSHLHVNQHVLLLYGARVRIIPDTSYVATSHYSHKASKRKASHKNLAAAKSAKHHKS